jgi:diaminopimelate epimerase
MGDRNIDEEYQNGARVLADWVIATQGVNIVEDMAVSLALTVLEQDMAQRDETQAAVDMTPIEFTLDYLATPTALLNLTSRILVLRGMFHLATVGAQVMFETEPGDVGELTKKIDDYIDTQTERYSAQGVVIPEWIDGVEGRDNVIEDTIQQILDGDE